MTGGGVSRLRSAAGRAGLNAALRATIAIALTAYVGWRAAPLDVLNAAASAAWPWIGAALLLVLIDRALMAFRWMVLLRALSTGTRPPFASVLRIFFVSTFVGSFLPSLAGDVYRAYSLSRLHVSGVESAASVIMDRALGVVSMVVVAVVSLAFASDLRGIPGVLVSISIAAAGCAAAAMALYNERIAALVQRTTGWLGPRLGRPAARLVEAVRRYRWHHSELTNVLITSIVVQVIRVLQAYCLGMSIAVTAPIWAYFVFVPLIVLVMQLPISVSGLGTSQLMFDLLFGRVGVSSPHAVALSILFIALGIAGNLPGALLYLSGGKAHAPIRTL
jgi:glycosyltransferase 2 family protein